MTNTGDAKSHENFSFLNLFWLRCRRKRGLVLATGAGVLLLAVILAVRFSRQAVILPDVPGAKYVRLGGLRGVP